MPTVHFVGSIDSAAGNDAHAVSLTYEILPGNAAWNLTNGDAFGETHIAAADERCMETLNHPLDVQYETFSSEGWPLLVCELWDRTHTGVRSLIGCGVTWLPQHGDHGSATNTPSSFGGNASTQSGGAFGASTLEVPLWRPQFRHREENSVGEIWSYEDVAVALLPYQPPLKLLREMAIDSFKKSQVEAQAAGSVVLRVTTITNGFSGYGVQL